MTTTWETRDLKKSVSYETTKEVGLLVLPFLLGQARSKKGTNKYASRMSFLASGFIEYEGTTCTQIRCLSAHSFHRNVLLEVETGAPKCIIQYIQLSVERICLMINKCL